MTSTKVLKILLQIIGVIALFALIGVLMPLSWMTGTHRWLGLGEMPSDPIVEYLARSLSAFYAFIGVLCLIVAADLERYRSLVRRLGVLIAAFGVVQLGIDLTANFPLWWTASEGPLTIVFGVWIFFLARQNG